MIQYILVALIVTAAVVAAVRTLVWTLRGRHQCSCGCDHCPYSGQCRK